MQLINIFFYFMITYKKLLFYTGTIPTEALSEHAGRLAFAAKTLEITPLRILAEDFVSDTSAAEGCGREEAVKERCVHRQSNQSPLEPTVYVDSKEDNTNKCATENVQNDSGSNTEAQSDGERDGYGDLVTTVDGHGSANSTNLVIDSSVVSAGKLHQRALIIGNYVVVFKS